MAKRPNSPAVRGFGGWWSPREGRSREGKRGGTGTRGRSSNDECERDMMRENDKQSFQRTHYLLHLGLQKCADLSEVHFAHREHARVGRSVDPMVEAEAHDV